MSVQDALNQDEFGKSIILNLSPEFILTGSTALSEQGTILRPDENPLHDIDFISTFGREETLKRFLEKYPDAIKIRDIFGEGYITDTYLIAPEGMEVADLKLETYTAKDGEERILVRSYNIVDSKTKKKKGSFELKEEPVLGKNNEPELNKDGSPVTKKVEVSKGVEGKLLDFFSYENYSDLNRNEPFSYTDAEGNEIRLANWKGTFEAKIKFARYKDIWDYNRFIPTENLEAISKAQETTTQDIEAKKAKFKNQVSPIESYVPSTNNMMEKLIKRNIEDPGIVQLLTNSERKYLKANRAEILKRRNQWLENNIKEAIEEAVKNTEDFSIPSDLSKVSPSYITRNSTVELTVPGNYRVAFDGLKPNLDNEYKFYDNDTSDGSQVVVPLSYVKKINVAGVDIYDSALTKTTSPETEVEQTAREKAIEENFNSIIKTLDSSKLMLDAALDGNYIGKKKC